MCIVCCSQFRGWCKACTRTEIWLSMAQAILLSGFIAFLIFLTLHFIACSKRDILTDSMEISHSTIIIEKDLDLTTKSFITTIQKSLLKNVECSWNPSQTTEAVTHYYLTKNAKPIDFHNTPITTNVDQHPKVLGTIKQYTNDSDGIVDVNRKDFVLALVKIKPPTNVLFGCILTALTNIWLITAASCIESIEEVDSLDSFVIMENFGEIMQGPIHMVSDINIHPLYQGTHKSYDLTAIKSEDMLNNHNVAQLPIILDYLLNNLGESVDILGFGKFRSIDKNPTSRAVRSVAINLVPLQKCESSDEWTLRHLLKGEAVYRSECEAKGGPICAAASRGSQACNYCAGAPLLRRNVLLGIMSENKHCGLSCEPNLYVNIAAVRDWLYSVIYLE